MTARGRPREFERDEALRRAMKLFWERGYEGASLADLTAVMGINKPSLYAAFGSKEALFREAIHLYSATDGSATTLALAEPTARAAVEAMLRGNAEYYGAPGKPSGCMIILAAALGSPESESASEFVRELRLRSERDLKLRFEQAVAAGELPASSDCAGLAGFYIAVLNGLSVQARDGGTRRELQSIVDLAMAAWDSLIARGKRGKSNAPKVRATRGRRR